MRSIFALLLSLPVLVFADGLLLSATKPIVTIEGSLPRGSDVTSFDFIVKVSGITAAKSGSERYAHRLEIFVKEANESTAIPFEDIGTQEDKDRSSFYLSYNGNETSETDNNNLITAMIYLTVNSKNDKLSELLQDNKKLTLQVQYKKDGQESEQKEQVLEVEAGVPAEAPNNISVKGTHLGISASWDNSSKVPYTKGDAKAPSAVRIYVVERSVGSIELAGTQHNPNAEADTESTTCTIDTIAGDDSSCVTCACEKSGDSGCESGSKGSYINKSETHPAIKTALSSASGGKATVTGLEEDGEYLIFLMYEPDGIARSKCYLATATRNFSWSESMDPSIEAKRKDPRCFIATAAYGSPLHADVELFRWFRDTYLMRHSLGQKFVAFYYETSPRFARLIEDHPWLKKIAQAVLYPVARMIEWSKSK